MSSPDPRHAIRWIALSLLCACPIDALSQENPPATGIHEHVGVSAPLLTPARETSGTSWLPEVTPMYGLHSPRRGWDIRVNGAAFVQALYEPRDRHRTGGESIRQGGSANWIMLMARRSVGGGRFGVRTMVSAEPWTVPGCGSLSFLAVGDLCDGDTIHDRQQPHDLFMELAVDYDRVLRGDWRWQIYAGLAGEPALGPPTYTHRPSAVANPLGPITHHWLESTHATFGLVTVGVHNQRWKGEMSAFNGRDPDDSRADLDLGAFDSYAARVSWLAADRLALQISAGRLREARTHFVFQSDQPVVRVTASAAYHQPLRADGIWATTVAFGANHAREPLPDGSTRDVTSAGALLESSVTLANRHTMFVRGELAGMPAHHLHAFEYGTSIFTVGKAQLGYVRHLRAARGIVPGVGGSLAVSVLPPQLAPLYFGRVAPSVSVFFSLQAARHQM
jgi:hypothetical protein